MILDEKHETGETIHTAVICKKCNKFPFNNYFKINIENILQKIQTSSSSDGNNKALTNRALSRMS